MHCSDIASASKEHSGTIQGVHTINCTKACVGVCYALVQWFFHTQRHCVYRWANAQTVPVIALHYVSARLQEALPCRGGLSMGGCQTLMPFPKTGSVARHFHYGTVYKPRSSKIPECHSDTCLRHILHSVDCRSHRTKLQDRSHQP